MFGQQHFPVSILPQDFGYPLAEAVYFRFPFVPDELRKRDMKGFMAEDFKMAFSAQSRVDFNKGVIWVLMSLTPRPLISERAIDDFGDFARHFFFTALSACPC